MYKPKNITLTTNSINVLNSVRNDCSPYYKASIREITDAHDIREIGNIFSKYPALLNEFQQNLYNKVVRTLIVSKTFNDPLKNLKKGIFEPGDTLEYIFTDVAKAHTFNDELAETEWMKREFSDTQVHYAFTNYKKYYKVSISHEQTIQAFNSVSAFINYINNVITSLYNAEYADEYLAVKYLCAKAILSSYYNVVETSGSSNDLLKKAKSVLNRFLFPSRKYNFAGVKTQTSVEDSYIFVTADTDANLDVDILAYAFNLEKTNTTNKILFDSFTFTEDEQKDLEILFNDDNYTIFTRFTDEENKILSNIQAIVCDKEFLQITTRLLELKEAENGQGLYRQYWLHCWNCLTLLPFANVCMFYKGERNKITKIKINDVDRKTLNVGDVVNLTAEITGTGYYNKQITWFIEGGNTTISKNGTFMVHKNDSGKTLKVTAKVDDKTDTLNFTVN